MLDVEPFRGPVTFMDRGACLGRPDDLWNDCDEGLAGQRRTEYARWICETRCPVIADCRAYALDNHIKHGVWGGLSQDQRKAILSDRYRERQGKGIIRAMGDAKTSSKAGDKPAAKTPVPTKVRVAGSDLDRLTTLRALITEDGSVHTVGRTAKEWLALVDFEGTDAEFVEWIELQGRAGALVVRDGDRLAVA